MGNRVGQLCLIVGAFVVAVVTTVASVNVPMVAVGAVALLLLALFALAQQMDGWRWLLGLTMVLLVCASSKLPSLVEASFYPRYAAVAALTFWGLRTPGAAATRLDPWTRLLIGALWAMAGLATLSFTWSVVPLETLQRGVALLLLAALVHVLIRCRWADRAVMLADLRVVYLVLSGSALLSLGLGLADGTLVAALSQTDRFEGLYNNPNMLSIVCALTTPLGWAVYRASRRRAELLGMVPAVACLLLSQSRTGLIAVLVGALWVVLRHGLGRMVRIAAGLAAGLLVAYLFNLLPILFAGPWMRQLVLRFTDPTGGDLSNGRTEMWQATLDLWWQNRPTLGFGYASRNHLFALASLDESLGTGVSVVHNSYLQLLLELGLAAVAPLALLLLAVGRVALRAPVRRADSGLVWLVVTGVLIQITESAIFGTGQTYPYVFWLVAAGVLRHLPDRRADADDGVEPSPAPAHPHQVHAPVDAVPRRPVPVLR
ncbi:O-antigen ligase family protein [Micromonospora antibiotica]|uniref:O-antigen ligase family protein n=1 Tax=Micromonospora antibiotica TaxID=2807623 RepID=A0ABS3VCU4_9ACTN|nr:O-antigen ligase family protein [Micromonospora antibiotica]MBO4163436.1 O-antigen ligase family protein [Micromonospora antibiotica]